MSPEELARARSRRALDPAILLLAQAESLPLPDGSVGAVLSHLAMMLMSDIERVIAEAHRVLTPGGTLATVVGGGPLNNDAFELFLDLLRPVLQRVGSSAPRLGDRRCRTRSGLDALFGRAADFIAPPEIEDFTVNLGGSFDAVWASLSHIYELYGMPAQATRALRASFEPAAQALASTTGTVPCSMFVRRVVTRKPG